MFLKLKAQHILSVAVVLFLVLNIYQFIFAWLVLYTIISVGITYSLMDKKSVAQLIYPISVIGSIGFAIFAIYLMVYFLNSPQAEDPQYSVLTNSIAELIADFILILPVLLLTALFAFTAAFITALFFARVITPISHKTYLFNLGTVFLAFAFYPVGMWYIHPLLNKMSR